MPRNRLHAATLLAALVASAACTERIIVCDPGARGCTQPVAQVRVVSPVDSVMVVGRTVQLNAGATDDRGNPVSGLTFTWRSTNPSAAIVDVNGLVAALDAGTTDVVATVDGVAGVFPMRTIVVDLGAVDSTLDESFVHELARSLDPPTSAGLVALLSSCATNVDIGHLLAADACLSDALGTEGVSGHDTALLGVLELFLERARRQLGLEG